MTLNDRGARVLWHRSRLLRRGFGALGVVGLGLVLWRATPGMESALAAVEWARGAGPLGVVVFVILHLAASLTMVPGSWPQMIAGFLYGPLLGVPLASLSSTGTATVAFLLARTWLRGPLERRLAHDVRFRAIDGAVDHGGVRLVALLRVSPIAPFSVMTYLLGLTRVSTRDFVVGTWVGSIPPVLLFVWIGSTARDLAAIVEGDVEGGVWAQVLALALTLIATAAVTRMARRSLRQAQLSPADADEAPEAP